MNHKAAWSIAALLYMNLLPYLCRLPRGLDWALQYLPDPGHEVSGLIFFHAFYSLPAIPLILAIVATRKSKLALAITFITVTVATCILNYGYDLASDAQAAIGLVFMPVFVMLTGFAGLGVGQAIQRLVDKVRIPSSSQN